jgi:ribonuclease P protein component
MTFPSNSHLSSNQKIRKSSEFKEVFDWGNRLNTENFTVIYNRNSLGFPRLGLVVGKKSSKSAVGRNRIKRILREIFRRNKNLFDSFDVVFLTKTKIETLDYKKAEAEISGIVGSKLL